MSGRRLPRSRSSASDPAARGFGGADFRTGAHGIFPARPACAVGGAAKISGAAPPPFSPACAQQACGRRKSARFCGRPAASRARHIVFGRGLRSRGFMPNRMPWLWARLAFQRSPARRWPGRRHSHDHADRRRAARTASRRVRHPPCRARLPLGQAHAAAIAFARIEAIPDEPLPRGRWRRVWPVPALPAVSCRLPRRSWRGLRRPSLRSRKPEMMQKWHTAKSGSLGVD